MNWVVETLPTSEPSHIVLALAAYFGYKKYKEYKNGGKSARHLRLMKSYSIIDHRLRDLCYDIGVDRALLLEIHNGANNLGDIQMLKVSMRNHGSKVSAAPITTYVSNTPLGFYSTLFSEILDGTPLVIPDIEKSEFLDQDTGLKRILRLKGARGISLYPIKGMHGTPFAVGLLISTDLNQDLSEEDVEKASHIFDQCGGMLLSLKED